MGRYRADPDAQQANAESGTRSQYRSRTSCFLGSHRLPPPSRPRPGCGRICSAPRSQYRDRLQKSFLKACDVSADEWSAVAPGVTVICLRGQLASVFAASPPFRASQPEPVASCNASTTKNVAQQASTPEHCRVQRVWAERRANVGVNGERHALPFSPPLPSVWRGGKPTNGGDTFLPLPHILRREHTHCLFTLLPATWPLLTVMRRASLRPHVYGDWR